MKHRRKVRLQHQRLEWKRSDYVPINGEINYDLSGNPFVKVTVSERSFVCPWCGKKKTYIVANGHIIKGGGGHYINDLEHCGSKSCDAKVERYIDAHNY